MFQSKFDHFRANKLVNTLGWILVTILLGAIGSGLWEQVLSPISSFIGKAILTILTQISASYSDSLHKGISRDGILAYSTIPFVVTSVIIICLPWVVPVIYRMLWQRQLLRLRMITSNHKIDPYDPRYLAEYIKMCRILFHAGWLVALLSSIVYMHVVFEAKYVQRAATFTERSLDILAPNLSEEERLRLRADYRSIESASDFSKLYDRLMAIALKENIKLPKFDPILRKNKD